MNKILPLIALIIVVMASGCTSSEQEQEIHDETVEILKDEANYTTSKSKIDAILESRGYKIGWTTITSLPSVEQKDYYCYENQYDGYVCTLTDEKIKEIQEDEEDDWR